MERVLMTVKCLILSTHAYAYTNLSPCYVWNSWKTWFPGKLVHVCQCWYNYLVETKPRLIKSSELKIFYKYICQIKYFFLVWNNFSVLSAVFWECIALKLGASFRIHTLLLIMRRAIFTWANTLRNNVTTMKCIFS